MLRLNRHLVTLAWVLVAIGWVMSWAINQWLEPVAPGALGILGTGTLLLAPATWYVRRAPARPGSWVAYASLTGVITVANLAFDNPDLWILYLLLGLVRVVYKDSYLHLISGPLSMVLYAFVLWLNPEHSVTLSKGQMVTRLFILFCFHALSHVVHMSVGDLRPRPARTALRLLGQMALAQVRRRRRARMRQIGQ